MDEDEVWFFRHFQACDFINTVETHRWHINQNVLDQIYGFPFGAAMDN